MEIVVVSPPREIPNEIEEVVRMFDAGLMHFHIRKPRMTKNQLADYIQRFPEKFRSRMVLHTYHGLAYQYRLGGIHLTRQHRKRKAFYALNLKLRRKLNPGMIVTRTFHKLTDITSDRRKYTYAFLSPVFDSVTRSTLAGGFSKRALLIVLPQAKQPMFALGGITVDRLDDTADKGFDGAAFHGAIWESDRAPHLVFEEALSRAREIGRSA